jgi:hypothetical protein
MAPKFGEDEGECLQWKREETQRRVEMHQVGDGDRLIRPQRVRAPLGRDDMPLGDDRQRTGFIHGGVLAVRPSTPEKKRCASLGHSVWFSLMTEVCPHLHIAVAEPGRLRRDLERAYGQLGSTTTKCRTFDARFLLCRCSMRCHLLMLTACVALSTWRAGATGREEAGGPCPRAGRAPGDGA